MLPLDGAWQYATDPGDRGIRKNWFDPAFDAAAWKTMPVPSQWFLQGLDYHGVAWFRHEFDLPADFPGEALELAFGAVDYDARVWVNGRFAGRHIGPYASFKLDATGAIHKGARNTLVVRVDSPIDPGYSPVKTMMHGNNVDDICQPYGQEGCQGGIYRSVTLVGRGPVALVDPWTVATVSEDLQRAEVTVKCELRPTSGTTGAVTVKCRLTEPADDPTSAPAGSAPAPGRVFNTEQTVTLAADGPTTLALPITLDRPKLWWPWEQGAPNLHTLELEIWRDGRLADRHVSRVGVRQVDFKRDESCVYVNHHRVFIKGMLNDDVHWLSLMDRRGYAQRLMLQKNANLNTVRMVAHQSQPEMYELCDELGMMVWQEMPLQWGYQASAPVRRDILRVIGETVRQCRPHAAVIGWSCWNEGTIAGFNEQIRDTIHGLDDGRRPVSLVCGAGDFDIHIYPNITPARLSRRTFFWTGLKLGFVSEVGAYGLSSAKEIDEMLGPDWLPFDSAEYFWETFNSYRYNDGPVFQDAPNVADWPTSKVRDYVGRKLEPSERWLCQFMKFMYENFRAQRFAPTTAAIHCRFDDPLPTAFLGVVNFNGHPRKAYYSVREVLQPVLPILFFDFAGAEDVRVVNDYWHQGWTGCQLEYVLTSREGRELRRIERSIDQPPDSTVTVLTREEAGDLYHLPGGFRAELTVRDSAGRELSRNHYDLTEAELQAFLTSVYPAAPARPLDAVVVLAKDAATLRGVARRVAAAGTYGGELLELDAIETQPSLKYEVNLPTDGACLVRVACNRIPALRAAELLVDGKPAEQENYPYTDMADDMTRQPYSALGLSWRPGWRTKLTCGPHELELRWPAPTVEGKAVVTTGWLVDALALQPDRAIVPSAQDDVFQADPATTDNKLLK